MENTSEFLRNTHENIDENFFEENNSYLTFQLGNELFAVPVSKVLNILEISDITRIPNAAPHLRGVINLRGSVLPLIDTRIKFHLPDSPFTRLSCIIVMNIAWRTETITVGALVDAVHEVVEAETTAIMPVPLAGSKYQSDMIIGILRAKEKFFKLIDADIVLTP